MKAPSVKSVRCAIYTRVSTEHGLDQEFNSLDAQYEAASAYIKSQPMPAGPWSGPAMTMAATPAAPRTGPIYKGCSMTSAPGRSMSSSSTRWTG